MHSNETLIKEARKRDKEVLGQPGILTQLADALEYSEAALKFKQGLIEDISADCERAEARVESSFSNREALNNALNYLDQMNEESLVPYEDYRNLHDLISIGFDFVEVSNEEV